MASPKKLSLEEARKKALHYCAYQERSHQEVKSKLYAMGLYSSEVDELLAYLITEGFLNEERFAKAFAGGKFRMKKWGRLRILQALESKGLTKNCIRIGLQEIDQEDYEKTLVDLLASKKESVDEPNTFQLRDKLSKYAIQKGFEPDLVWKKLKELIPG
jgi:regulatory protein